MNKILSFMLVVLLLLSLTLCACGSNQNGPATVCDPHIDVDDNGFCDACNVSVIVNVDFYSINDLHGKFDDTSAQPGVDELSTYLRSRFHADENVVLLSCGDMWQGSSESNLTSGLLVTDWMNEMGFDSMTLGNHEFDWGEDVIWENTQLAKFPILGINVYSNQTNSIVQYCKPSVMIQRGEAQIGIIGAIGDCYSSIAADHTKDIHFVVGDELTELVRVEASDLRSKGADFIVYALHDGFGGHNYGDTVSDEMMKQYYQAVLSDGLVDLVFEAHTHKYYVQKDNYGVYHLQGGGDNTGITHADVDINIANSNSNVLTAEYISNDKYAHLSDDPIVDQLLEKYDEQIRVGREVLGYNGTPRNRDQLRQIAAQLYYDYGTSLWGREYDIVLGGGFFSVRSPGHLEAGKVTYSQLQMLFPFDNYLVLCSVQGRDLQEKFFETDNSNYFIAYGEYGRQVRNQLDPNETYYIVVDSYTSTYGPNHLTEIVRFSEPVFTRDLLAQYIQDGNMQ